MIERRSRGVNRSAFTLIELLVVMAIIAILVSLTTAAVMRAMWKIPEVETSTEIAEMSVALQAFMSDFNLDVPPPSTLTLRTTVTNYPAGDPSLAFLKKMFGKNLYAQGNINWGGTGGTTLNGAQCLVFYLGGIGNQGFSYNGMNPVPVAGQRTHGPYYTFQTSRLVAGTGNFPMYLDAWKVKTGPKPYAYFSSQGINNKYSVTDCTAIGAAPYFTPAGTVTAASQFSNPNTYQIISAGADGAFGITGWSPTGGATGAGADDQTNFSSAVLKAGQQ
jgi:prepilin-type N-terminal cleavage/methylation domain-containing protein